MFYSEDKNYFYIDTDPKNFTKIIEKGFYEIKEDNFSGNWYLKKISTFKKEDVYGEENRRRINKVISVINRDEVEKLGVLFFGEKGMGKTLSVRNISIEVSEKLNIPVLIVDQSVSFDNLKEIIHVFKKAVFIFDEFEKNFIKDSKKDNEDKKVNQEKLLSLLDGLDSKGKKLFLFSANDRTLINENLINRPSRIKYNFPYYELSLSSIEEYFEKNLKNKKSVNSSDLDLLEKFDINFDIMKTVIEELNYGFSFSETIQDLGLDKSITAIFKSITLKDGTVIEADLKHPYYISSESLIDLKFNPKYFINELFINDSDFEPENAKFLKELFNVKKGESLVVFNGKKCFDKDYEKITVDVKNKKITVELKRHEQIKSLEWILNLK